MIADRQRSEIDTREYSCRVTLTLEEAKAVQRRVQRSRASYLPYRRSLLYQLKFMLPVDLTIAKGTTIIEMKGETIAGYRQCPASGGPAACSPDRKERRKNG